MNIVPIHGVSFDDEATLAMGAAFDQACSSLRHFACADNVRELIAKRIIEAAINGERDVIRLHSQALMGFSIDDVSMPVASVGTRGWGIVGGGICDGDDNVGRATTRRIA